MAVLVFSFGNLDASGFAAEIHNRIIKIDGRSDIKEDKMHSFSTFEFGRFDLMCTLNNELKEDFKLLKILPRLFLNCKNVGNTVVESIVLLLCW